MISKTTNLATEATSRAPSWSITALEASFLLAATLLVYWPSYRAGFIWDDDAMIIDNPLIKADWDGLRDIWFSTKFHDMGMHYTQVPPSCSGGGATTG